MSLQFGPVKNPDPPIALPSVAPEVSRLINSFAPFHGRYQLQSNPCPTFAACRRKAKV
jgi:hypothetical protein